MLIPSRISNKISAKSVTSDEVEGIRIPNFKPENTSFQNIVHAALQIRGELKSWPGHSGLDVSEEACAKVVPDSLHLFLTVLLEGEKILDE